MNFTVCMTGKKIDKFYSEIVKEYQKRLSRYCKIQLIYIKNEQQLLKRLTDKVYKIIISKKGHQISSDQLAQKINKLAISGNSDVFIIIGVQNAPHDEIISISCMDMDLGLKVSIIFEQIYRAYRILNGEPYHK